MTHGGSCDDLSSLGTRRSDMSLENGGSHGEASEQMAELPEFVANAPAPLRALLVFLVFGNMRTGDDFDTYLRKIAVGIVCPLGIVGMGSMGITTLTSTGGIASKPGTLAAGLTYLCAACGFFFAWMMLKIWPDLHRRATVTALTLVSTSVFLLTFSDVTYPTWAAFAQIADGAQLVRASHLKKILFACAIGYAFATYNALVLEPKVPLNDHLLAIDQPLIRTQFTDRLVVFFGATFFFFVNSATIRATLKETARREAAASASAAVASAVADALARYDTTLAQRQLEAARGDGEADAELVAKLELIVENLTKYRPHLPNWMLPDAAQSGSTPSDSDDGDMENHSKTKKKKGTGPDDASDRADAKAAARYAVDDDGAASATSFASVTSTVHSAYGLAGGAPPPGVSPYAAHESGTPFKARVALAEVAFSIPSASDLVERLAAPSWAGTVPLMASAGHAFVDRVHRLAGATGGAVHAFVGDVARVTWNAAARVVQPEAKAARFLARLKQDLGHELVTAWGAAATGDARVQLGGSRQAKALLVTASGAGSETLKAALRTASRHCAFVVDGPTFAGARHAVRFRGCGVTKRVADAPTDPNDPLSATADALEPVVDATTAVPPPFAVPGTDHEGAAAVGDGQTPAAPMPPPSGGDDDTRLVATPPLHRFHARDVAPSYRRSRRRVRAGLFAVVEECDDADAEMDWLYAHNGAAADDMDPTAARRRAQRQHDALTCRAVECACRGDVAGALELLDEYVHGGNADPCVLEFAAVLAN